MLLLPEPCPRCGREDGLFWCPRDSYILCKAGMCDHSERANYVEFSRDSVGQACVRVIQAIRAGRYGESGALARVRVRICAAARVVRVESAYLWEFPVSDGKASVAPIERTIVKELREAGLPARPWEEGDRWR